MQLGIVAALLLQSLPMFADDVITNVMSPVLSYQYQEDFNSVALTSGGIMSPIASYQYFNALGELGATVGSAIVSYQYFEWPGGGVLQLLSSLQVSYFYQIGGDSVTLVSQGRVTDMSGGPLSGAIVSAMVGLTPVAQSSTDATGNYALPPLGVGIYVLKASVAGHASSARALTLSARTANQNFQLAALLAAPSIVQTVREHALPPGGPLGTLKIFDGIQFVPIDDGNSPQSDRMTIVLTHGRVIGTPNPAITNTPFDRWPTNMAAQLRSHGVPPSSANIVAWDWRYAATSPALVPTRSVDYVPSQGIALGHALQVALSNDYSKHLHFIGHSLGALVNAAAINYLHGDRTGGRRQETSSAPWSNAPVHVTVFDHAQIAEMAGQQVLFDGLNPTALDAWNTLFTDYNTTHNVQPPLPVHFTWADNYVSIAGSSTRGAVNVWLQKRPSIFDPDGAHAYPIEWYGMSIANPTDVNNPLGFRRSYEYTSSAFPPADIHANNVYHQAPLNSDPLALEIVPSITRSLGFEADVVIQNVVGGMQVAGNVTAKVVDEVETAAERISQGFGYVANEAMQGGQMILHLFNSPSLRLNLTTGLPPSQQQLSRSGVLTRGEIHPVKLDSSGAPNSPAMAWVPIEFPANTIAMAFDFTVEGDPVNDVLVCGVGETNLFSLEAKYVPTNTVSASPLIDMSAWANTTNELFFGFLGGTSTNATLQIDNIRFYSLAAPRLEIEQSDGVTRLSWPATAGGYIVQTTPALVPPIWEAIINAPLISAGRYVLTNSWSERSRFFRLRAR